MTNTVVSRPDFAKARITGIRVKSGKFFMGDQISAVDSGGFVITGLPNSATRYLLIPAHAVEAVELEVPDADAENANPSVPAE